MKIERSDEEINDLLNQCAEMADGGRNPFFGMTYAQGVEAGIRWIIGEEDESPLTD